MSRRDILLKIARARVLTTSELGMLLHLSNASAGKAAYDLKKRGFLTQVHRGMYASVPLDADPKGFRPDPYLAVQKTLSENLAFSHWSAVGLLGAEQAFRKTIHVSAPGVRSRRRALGGWVVHVHGVATKGWEGATTTARRGVVSLRVTTPERTLVDLASLPNREQDYEADLEAFRTLLPRSDPKRLQAAVLANPHVTARARVGHLLQATGARSSPRDPFRPVLEAVATSVAGASPMYFATRPREGSNRFDSRFQVVYPGRI